MATNNMHMAESGAHGFRSPKMHTIGSTILDSFTKLGKEKEHERVAGGFVLLKHLSQENSENGTSKELNYALARLIRGLGSSRESARKGFYAALTSFLSVNSEIETQRVLDLIETELHPVGSNPKGENADIYLGRILVCGALIRSTQFVKSSPKEQQKALEYLISAGKKRSYLSLLSTTFLVELIDRLDETSFSSILWPSLQGELSKSWNEQTLDTFYILLIARDKYPSVVKDSFLKKNLGSKEIINEKSIEALLSLTTNLPRIICYQHPVYKILCEKITSTGCLLQFWNGVDQRFVKPPKSIEHVAVEMLKLILSNVKDKSQIPSLLSTNFMQHMLKRFTSCKRNKNDVVAVMFKELLTVLVTAMNDKTVKPKIQIAVLKRLLLSPGNFMIEKITNTRVIQMITANLSVEGVKKLSRLYREIASNELPKHAENSRTESWTNVERAYAIQLLTRLMGHSEVAAEHEWRLEQLKFLFNLGLCESTNVGVELAPQFKDSFYRALDHKLPKLSDLRFVLSSLVHHLNSEVFSENTVKLRMPLSSAAVEAWGKMMGLIEKLEKHSRNEQATLIFHMMNLHMGLQLFSDPEMAVTSIHELLDCFERLKRKKSKKSRAVKNESEEEPEWMEVVVDLLLSLLSRNSHLLRSLVGCVFPHICPFLTATSVHQILEVLDPKDDKGPLVLRKEAGEDSDDESSSAESNSDVDDESDGNEEESAEDESESDSNEELSGDDEFAEDEGMTDRLRLAVRQALGDATAQTDDEDVDIDQIDENEGKRLDESLAAAFRIIKENRRNKSKKQEKSGQILTHFRVRVVDLLEAYLDSCPSMALTLDMLVPLFALLEFCIKNQHQKPLENRVRTCLRKLSAIKKFKSTEGVDEELLIVVLKSLIEKGERSASVCQEMGDKLAECCTFLVRCVQQANLPSDALIRIYGENLTAFFKKRDCVLPAVLFKSVLNLCWVGNWRLAPLLVDFAFDSSIRSFRRGQALEFLTIFYKNDRLVRLDETHRDVRLEMEKKLCANSINLLRDLSSARGEEAGKAVPNARGEGAKEIRQKFFCLLLTLLHTIRPHHLPQAWNWQDLAKAVAAYRSGASLAKDAKSAYNRLAMQIGLPRNVATKGNQNETVITNGQPARENGDGAGSLSEDADSSDPEESTGKPTKKEMKRRQKNRGKQKDKQKLKKEARELRARAMSDGLENYINFSSVVLTNGAADEILDKEPELNGDATDASTSGNVAQKRRTSETVELPGKSKKKKLLNVANGK